MKHDRSHWWNSYETVMNRHETWWISGMKHVESRWMSNETIYIMAMKHRESCWIRMKHFFHGHEARWIRMKQCVSWSWNKLFHGSATPWISFMLFQGVLLLYFIPFHGFSWLFTALFHDVPCCFKVILCSVWCCFKVFHCTVSWRFKVFQGVISLFNPLSWPWNGCSWNEPLNCKNNKCMLPNLYFLPLERIW